MKSVRIKPGTRILFVVPPQGDPRGHAIRAGAKQRAAFTPGLRIEFVSFPASIAEWKKIADAAPPAAAACVFLGDADISKAVIDSLITGGSLVVTIGDTAQFQNRAGIFGHVTIDDGNAAEQLGNNLSRLSLDCKSYVLGYADGDEGERVRQRFSAGIASRTQPILLSKTSFDARTGASANAIRRLLDTFPNTSLVVTLDPRPWVEQPPSLLLNDQQRFITLGASQPLWRFLQTGKALALVGTIEGDIGASAVEIATAGLRSVEHAPMIRIIHNEIVTSESLPDFSRRYAEAISETNAGTTSTP